jgi:hypothetical protein
LIAPAPRCAASGSRHRTQAARHHGGGVLHRAGQGQNRRDDRSGARRK